MGIPLYLAMTVDELERCPRLPEQLGWMACHFSPYGRGLTDLPEALPPGSLLLCDDRIPILHHDAALVAVQLAQLAKTLRCRAIVLDFQQPESAQGARIAEAVSEAAECPVVLPPAYAHCGTGPVLLPPPRLWDPISRVAEAWKGRTLWMEWVIQAAEVTVTETESRYTSLEQPPEPGKQDRTDPVLCCRYRTELAGDRAAFLLWDAVQTLEKKRRAAEKA